VNPSRRAQGTPQRARSEDPRPAAREYVAEAGALPESDPRARARRVLGRGHTIGLVDVPDPRADVQIDRDIGIGGPNPDLSSTDMVDTFTPGS